MGIESEEQETKSSSDDGGKELSSSQPDIVIEEAAKEVSDESEGGTENKKSESQERLNEGAKEDEEQPAKSESSPQKQSIWNRLFNKGKKNRSDPEAEGEAETELLSKEEMGAKTDGNSLEPTDESNEKKDGDNQKSERNGSSTDVTIAVTDEKESKKDTNTHTEPTFKWRSPYLRYALIALTAFFFLLVVIAIVTMQLAYQPPATESAKSMGAPLALTDCGQVHGRVQDEVFVFQGIPYALPPTGGNRWEPTVPITKLEDCWSGIYMATSPRSFCYQKPIPNNNFTYSEDCLYLNIYTPSLSQHQLRPVVVYIMGDSLLGLSEMDINWMPTPRLAKQKDVVFVTFNYRTGPFGFMALEASLRESQDSSFPTGGNYGFHDQLSALNWIQKNIQQFGGDANKVTVLGHGSGATSGLVLLTTKKSRDLHLFNRMWLTGPSGRFTNLTLDEVAEMNMEFQKTLGCETLKCLRDKSAEEIISAVPKKWKTDQYNYFPLPTEEPATPLVVIDGNILYDSPFNVWKEINITNVPLVVGVTAQEMGSYPISVDIENWTYDQLTTYMRDLLETLNMNLSSIVEEYFDNVTSTTLQYQTLVSDMRIVCPVQKVVQRASKSSQNSVYSYVVEYMPTYPVQMSEDSVPAQMAVHGIDVLAIFGLLNQYIPSLSESDREYQNTMQELFYSFVETGEPMVRNHPLKESAFVNVIGRQVEKRATPYGNCQLWEDFGLEEKFAKMN